MEEFTKQEKALLYKMAIIAINHHEESMTNTNPGALHYWNLSDELSRFDILKNKILKQITK